MHDGAFLDGQLALAGSRAALSTWSHDAACVSGLYESEVVYIIDTTTGQMQQYELRSPEGPNEGTFGTSLTALGDHHLLVGGTAGMHLFNLDTGAWLATARPLGSGGFGNPIVLDDQRFAVANSALESFGCRVRVQSRV